MKKFSPKREKILKTEDMNAIFMQWLNIIYKIQISSIIINTHKMLFPNLMRPCQKTANHVTVMNFLNT